MQLPIILRDMYLPVFQPWLRWADRSRTANCERSGVYLLARFNKRPPRVVDPRAKEVIYIGETCSQALTARWYQFNCSAFLRKAGHSGGWTFSTTYCGDEV